MSASRYLAQAVLNYLASNTSNIDTQPTLYVRLWEVLPGDDGTGGTEASDTNYAAESTANTDWSAATLATPSVLSNATIVDFGTFAGDGNALVGVTIHDAAAAGNMLMKLSLTTPKTPGAEPVTFPIGTLNFNAQ